MTPPRRILSYVLLISARYSGKLLHIFEISEVQKLSFHIHLHIDLGASIFLCIQSDFVFQISSREINSTLNENVIQQLYLVSQYLLGRCVFCSKSMACVNKTVLSVFVRVTADSFKHRMENYAARMTRQDCRVLKNLVNHV